MCIFILKCVIIEMILSVTRDKFNKLQLFNNIVRNLRIVYVLCLDSICTLNLKVSIGKLSSSGIDNVNLGKPSPKACELSNFLEFIFFKPFYNTRVRKLWALSSNPTPSSCHLLLWTGCSSSTKVHRISSCELTHTVLDWGNEVVGEAHFENPLEQAFINQANPQTSRMQGRRGTKATAISEPVGNN